MPNQTNNTHFFNTIEAQAQNIGLKTLQEAYKKFSSNYRHDKLIQQLSYESCISYALARMPGTLSAQKAVLKQVASYLKDTKLTVIDIGAGPGTSLLSLESEPWVKNLVLLETNTNFIDLLKKAHSLGRFPFPVEVKKADICEAQIPKGDLLLSGYCLSEVNNLGLALKSIEIAAKRYILIIEPGTPAGFQTILDVRDYFISKGSKILAPCMGNYTCPLNSSNKAVQTWCHFRTNVARQKMHKYIKEGTLGFEEEPYIYVFIDILGQDKPIPNAGRLISSPTKNKFSISGRVCTKEGVGDLSILKKEKEAYAALKKKKWGDLVNLPLQAQSMAVEGE